MLLPDRVTTSAQHDGATLIVAHDVEGILADIDTGHSDRGIVV